MFQSRPDNFVNNIPGFLSKFGGDDMIFNLGQMHLNKLREIKRFKDEKFRFANICDEDDSSDDE